MGYANYQANSFQVVEGALASNVAPAGTFTVSYPTGFNPGSFQFAMAHKITIGADTFYFPVDFNLTFGATSITVTNATTGSTWLQGKAFRLQLEEPFQRSQMDYPLQFQNSATDTIGGSSQSINVRAKLFKATGDMWLDLINLGAPIAFDDDGIAAAQTIGAAGTLSINGSLAVSGVVSLDVPRALQVDSAGANTAVITITGTDAYGRPMSEAITLNGTTQVNGKKAFKTVTLAVASAAVANPMTIGTTDILGLPVFVPSDGYVIQELREGHPVGNSGTQQVAFTVNQVDLLAGTAQSYISPVNGFITGAKAVVSKNTIVTGGNIAIKVGTTDVAGLTLVFPDTSVPGAVVSDTPTTPFSSTTVVTAGSRIQIAPDASFATSGDINGYVEVTGLGGLLVAGIRTSGGSTTTTGDVRGTYLPAIACDGLAQIAILVAVGQRYPGISQGAIAGA